MVNRVNTILHGFADYNRLLEFQAILNDFSLIRLLPQGDLGTATAACAGDSREREYHGSCSGEEDVESSSEQGR